MKTIRPSESRIGSGKSSPLGRCAVVVAFICAAVTSWGAARADQDRPAGEPRTTVLFDGKSLDGWEKTDFANAGEVKVEDGSIHMAAGRPMTGITSLRKDLPRTNYELSYEAMRLAGRDFFAAATFPVGDSYITLVNGGWGGNVTGLSSIDGVDASENETGRLVKYENKTWYRFRVRVTPEVIRCQVDDKEVAAVNYRDHHVGTRIETRACQPLGFATWASSAAVRNIAIRPLTPAEVEATNKSVR
jgi:hypothetical protein